MRLAAPHSVMLNGVDTGAGAPAAVPGTPKPPNELDRIIDALDCQWGLELTQYNECSTPSSHNRTPAHTVYRRIQFLYFKGKSDLYRVLEDFDSVAPGLSQAERLGALSGLVWRAWTLVTARLQSQPPKPASRVPQLETIPLDEPKQSHYATAPDLGSPTDDEDDYTAPQSPILSSVSAQRRVQASPHFLLSPIAGKRPLDSCDKAEKPTKLTRTLKGKQPMGDVPAQQRTIRQPVFKKPPLRNTRIVKQPSAIIQPSVDTSFNSMQSSQQTIFSQQSQPDTANTSFASESDYQKLKYSDETEHSKGAKTKSSSVSYGPLGDQDILDLSKRLENYTSDLQRKLELKDRASQGLTQKTSSTFGSVDEDGLIDVSFEVQAQEHLIHPMPTDPALQDRSTSQADNRPKTNKRCLSPKKSKPVQPFTTKPPSPLGNLIPELASAKPNPTIESPSYRKSPNRITPAESPRKIEYHISSITEQGLFVEDIPDELKCFPYHVVFICQRIAIESSLTLPDVMQSMDVSSVGDPVTFWNKLQSHPNLNNTASKESNRLWAASKRRYEGFTFKGQINLRNKHKGPIFNLRLMPIHADNSCRFQRHFGSDRFLYLDTPELNTSEIQGFNAGDRERIRERWTRWLKIEHTFMGRKWRVFHLEPLKRAKKAANRVHDKRIVLFATEGWGVTHPCSVGEMLDWFFGFARNSKQSYCKAYARFDLGLSRTLATLEFKPSQIRHVNDCLANGEPEATKYNDTKLFWPKVSPGVVMNDGCSVMSVGAAREIWKKYKKATGVSGPLPSAFQGRIAGAKGLWMISAESYTQDPEHLKIWIQISSSQLKFEPHKEDLDDKTYDPHRLTFEVSNYSSASTSSELHISFIPIMVDRGVSKEIIAGFVIEQLKYEREILLEKLTDPVKTYDYVHKNGATSRDVAETGPVMLPESFEERTKMLLESGFVPTQFHFLARNLQYFIKMQQARQEAKLRTPLRKSTFLYGVADPLGVLEPGQIQVQFSTSFTDEMTDETYLCLRNTDLLVARHPACRRSDIQKVHAIVHPDLSHLVDVVVFPSRGEYPLAGKLQGGDYDGDLFWICWESILVDPFKNAPAPVENPDPGRYGIETDKKKLSEVMNVNNLADVDSLLEKAFDFREQPSLLGMVTDYLEEQVYSQNRVHSRSLDQLCDIHDLLVDALKQGYTFTREGFERYKFSTQAKLKIPKPVRPAYKAAMKDCLEKKPDAEKPKLHSYRHKPDNVLDFLYFEIVCKQNADTMDLIKLTIPSERDTEPDDALLYPYQHLKSLDNPTINAELHHMINALHKIRVTWNSAAHGPTKTSAEWNKTVLECLAVFRAIQPTQPTHPDVAPWLVEHTRPGSCLWDVIRASTLYAMFSKKAQSTFVWQLAAGELARLKADSVPGTRAMVAGIRTNMRPKPVKTMVLWDDEDEGAEESDDDDFVTAVG